MGQRYSTSFKIQAVEKALRRDQKTSIKAISDSLGIGFSTLSKWIVKSRNKEFEMATASEKRGLKNEKRPEDWGLSDRLNMVIRCNGLSEEKLSALCRSQGLYPHHIQQWKLAFLQGETKDESMTKQTDIRALKSENKTLRKELNRKEKALAEAAALLVLQKKVKALWGNEQGEII